MNVLRTDAEFWLDLDELVATSEVRVDRPAGQPHPDFPELIYPFDYGCLAATTGGDGAEIDVWIGSLTELTVTAVACKIGRASCRERVLMAVHVEGSKQINELRR